MLQKELNLTLLELHLSLLELHLSLLHSKAESERTEAAGGGGGGERRARSMARSMQYVTLLGKACTPAPTL